MYSYSVLYCTVRYRTVQITCYRWPANARPGQKCKVATAFPSEVPLDENEVPYVLFYPVLYCTVLLCTILYRVTTTLQAALQCNSNCKVIVSSSLYSDCCKTLNARNFLLNGLVFLFIIQLELFYFARLYILHRRQLASRPGCVVSMATKTPPQSTRDKTWHKALGATLTSLLNCACGHLFS